MRRKILWPTTYVLFVAVFELCSAGTQAAVLWDEAVNGELSGDRLAPTPLTLGSGTNSLIGGVEQGELDYVTIQVPTGFMLTNLFLTSYVGEDFTAFIAIQSGSTFTAAPPAPPVSSLLGYTHFGPGAPLGANVGDDLLFPMALAAGAQHFLPPLSSGNYSFWIQQTGQHCSYQFDFAAVPEPSSYQLAVYGVMGLALVRRRIPSRRRSRLGFDSYPCG